ncbi:hypothetical protein F5Y18DRAFT_146862 [Xylariaceae sp. FL1019]|nr:hypothetical protein F5Y18DRAFT_146862 [Xylariaceae sp. FL1019]
MLHVAGPRGWPFMKSIAVISMCACQEGGSQKGGRMWFAPPVPTLSRTPPVPLICARCVTLSGALLLLPQSGTCTQGRAGLTQVCNARGTSSTTPPEPPIAGCMQEVGNMSNKVVLRRCTHESLALVMTEPDQHLPSSSLLVAPHWLPAPQHRSFTSRLTSTSSIHASSSFPQVPFPSLPIRFPSFNSSRRYSPLL